MPKRKPKGHPQEGKSQHDRMVELWQYLTNGLRDAELRGVSQAYRLLWTGELEFLAKLVAEQIGLSASFRSSSASTTTTAPSSPPERKATRKAE